jgi:hypothetical protein
MPDFRVTINHWLDPDVKSAVRDAGYEVSEKAVDEESSSHTQYTEIVLSAPDEEAANRTTADLLGFVQGDQAWDVEPI